MAGLTSGPLPWQVIKIVAPLGLVALGVGGLALSRNRSQTCRPRKVIDDATPIPRNPRRGSSAARSNRIIGGVCGGVADYLNMDVTLVRILTVLISLFTGVPVILYIIALFVVPEEHHRAAPAPPPVTGASTYSGPFSGRSPRLHRPRTRPTRHRPAAGAAAGERRPPRKPSGAPRARRGSSGSRQPTRPRRRPPSRLAPSEPEAPVVPPEPDEGKAEGNAEPKATGPAEGRPRSLRPHRWSLRRSRADAQRQAARTRSRK